MMAYYLPHGTGILYLLCFSVLIDLTQALHTSSIIEHIFKCLQSARKCAGCWGLKGKDCLVRKIDNSGRCKVMSEKS